MRSRCVIISDTKRGHENQSRVLARMLGDSDPLVMNLRPRIRNGGLAELSLRIRMALLGGKAFDAEEIGYDQFELNDANEVAACPAGHVPKSTRYNEKNDHVWAFNVRQFIGQNFLVIDRQDFRLAFHMLV